MEQPISGRIDAVEMRLETIEDVLSQPDRMVTEEQASQVSQAVKAVALALGKASGRNEFGGVYGELYRKFGVASYKMLPARRFQEAMRFLAEWYETVTGGRCRSRSHLAAAASSVTRGKRKDLPGGVNASRPEILAGQFDAVDVGLERCSCRPAQPRWVRSANGLAVACRPRCRW